jgi:hypothetical protein
MIASAAAVTPDSPIKAAGVEVRSSRSVLPNHFWLGVNGTVNAA